MNTKQLSVLYALACILGIALVGFLTVGFAGVLFSAAFVGGFVFWMATSYRTPIDPYAVMIPYLLMVVLFIIHVYEEYLFHIEHTLAAISGFVVSQTAFLTIAAFTAPVVWLIGALMMLKRWHFGYFLASTFLFGMMFAEPSHFLFPFLEDGTFHYTAGMYTALLPCTAGWYCFFIMLREITKENKNHALPR
jgi:hypothetical protein